MNKNNKEQREKEYIAISKKIDELSKKIRNAEVETLSEPYQNGWTVSLRLRDDAFRRHDGPRMLEALKLCIYPAFTNSPKLVAEIRKNNTWENLQKIFTHSYKSLHNVVYSSYVGPQIKSISVKKFNTFEEGVKKFFRYECTEKVSYWGGQTYKDEKYVLDIPKFYIEAKVQKRMVSKKIKIDPDVISECEYLKNVRKTHFYDIYSRGSRKSSWWGYKSNCLNKQSRRHSNDAIKKVMNGEIDDVKQYHKLTKTKKSV